jgi:hypothetical protein
MTVLGIDQCSISLYTQNNVHSCLFVYAEWCHMGVVDPFGSPPPLSCGRVQAEIEITFLEWGR